MRPTLREILAAFGRPFAFVPFFAILYLLAALVALLDHTVHCFPVTAVTTDRAVAERLAALPGNCSAAVEAEKFMIESAIFNDTDIPPVRDIYLVAIEGDYAAWEELQRTPGAVVEMNPFLKRVADLYLTGRLKLLSASFAIGVIAAVLTFPVALPVRTPFRRLDLAATIFGWVLFGALLIGGAVMAPPVFLPAYLLAAAAGMLFALVFRILMKKYETKEGTA